jgi:arylsulfatase A-like enzyme
MLTAMDDAIGRIVAAVERRGLRKNTLFVFSSDNGGPAPGRTTDNGPLRAGKGTLYEGGVRVAAFATWDGVIKPGTKVDVPLHIVDWFPTLVKLAGGSLDQSFPLDGRDAWPAITAGAPSPHDAILLNTTPSGGAIRVGDWKFVLNGDKNDETDPNAGRPSPKQKPKETLELFNLADDPSEKTNLAETKPEKLAELRRRYEASAREAVPPKSAAKAADFKTPAVWGESD